VESNINSRLMSSLSKKENNEQEEEDEVQQHSNEKGNIDDQIVEPDMTTASFGDAFIGKLNVNKNIDNNEMTTSSYALGDSSFGW